MVWTSRSIRPMPLAEASVTRSNRMLHHATQTFLLWAHTDTPAFEISSSAGRQKACLRGRRYQSFCRTDWRARTPFVLISRGQLAAALVHVALFSLGINSILEFDERQAQMLQKLEE